MEMMMSASMKNPALVLPESFKPLQALYGVVSRGGVPPKTLHLAHLRASQINGCSFCIDSGIKDAKKDGETDERLFAVSAWRETPYFNPAERAALALAESMTRLADKAEVPDAIWNDAASNYDEKELAALVLWIAVTNLYNRVNVTTRQPPGVTWN
jgi:AhpD family alkylhydroperoxidase